MTSLTEVAEGEKCCKGIDFCMWLKLSWYQFKIDYFNLRAFYVTSLLTTKKTSVKYRQKEMKAVRDEIKIT